MSHVNREVFTTLGDSAFRVVNDVSTPVESSTVMEREAMVDFTWRLIHARGDAERAMLDELMQMPEKPRRVIALTLALWKACFASQTVRS